MEIKEYQKRKLPMTDDAIKDLLLSPDLSEIETAITRECETYINKDHIDFTIGSLRREINNSGLSIEYIRKHLYSKKDSIITFGIRFLNRFKDAPIEEEYPKGESVPKSQRPQVISSHGVGIGFGVKYAIYYDFLINRPKELIDFVKKERIPKANKFCKTLKELYNSKK